MLAFEPLGKSSDFVFCVERQNKNGVEMNIVMSENDEAWTQGLLKPGALIPSQGTATSTVSLMQYS